MKEVTIPTQKELKPSPTLNLTGKIGNFVKGRIVKLSIPNPSFPNVSSFILAVDETNGSTVMWDKESETEKEVEISRGDTVFLRKGKALETAASSLKEGDLVKITFEGEKDMGKGKKPLKLYDVKKYV